MTEKLDGETSEMGVTRSRDLKEQENREELQAYLREVAAILSLLSFYHTHTITHTISEAYKGASRSEAGAIRPEDAELFLLGLFYATSVPHSDSTHQSHKRVNPLTRLFTGWTLELINFFAAFTADNFRAFHSIPQQRVTPQPKHCLLYTSPSPRD